MRSSTMWCAFPIYMCEANKYHSSYELSHVRLCHLDGRRGDTLVAMCACAKQHVRRREDERIDFSAPVELPGRRGAVQQ